MRKIWMGLIVVMVLIVLAWTMGIFAEDVQVAGGSIEEKVKSPQSSVVNPGKNRSEKNPLNVIVAGPIEDPMENSDQITDPTEKGPKGQPGHSKVVNPGKNRGVGNPHNITPEGGPIEDPMLNKGPIEDPMTNAVGPIEDPIVAVFGPIEDPIE